MNVLKIIHSIISVHFIDFQCTAMRTSNKKREKSEEKMRRKNGSVKLTKKR